MNHPLAASFRSLQARWVLAAVGFLVILTIAVVLVVRDSLNFAGRNMAAVGEQALRDQRRDSLLAIVRREAELNDHAVHHEENGLESLTVRLDDFAAASGGYAYVINSSGELLAVSSGYRSHLVAELPDPLPATSSTILLQTQNEEFRSFLEGMAAGREGVVQLTLAGVQVQIASAPMAESGWAYAIVEPLDQIAANAAPLTNQIQDETGSILRATIVTITYFAVLAVVGVVLVARRQIGPIRTLVEGTRAISAGSLDVRIPVHSRDELGVLADSFNKMAESLEQRTRELVEANEAAVKSARLVEQAKAIATLEERQRLARELHDSVTQSLYSLTLLAEASRRTALTGNPERVAGLVSRLGETAQQALKEMRLLVYELRPIVLETDGLAGAILQRLDAVEKRAGIRTVFENGVADDFPQETSHTLFRIAQEALNNAIKHAGATEVSVTIRESDGMCELVVQDNGTGFDPAAIADHGGMGLENIRSRALEAGGWVEISSTMGAGTRVIARVPIRDHGV